MASIVNSAKIQTNDPGDSAMSPDPGKGSTIKGVGDNVTVSLTEGKVNVDGKGVPTNLELVLAINADSGASVNVQADGSVKITASAAKPTKQFVICQMNTADPGNWTLVAVTSGGSTYKYIKGGGGGGH